MERTNRVELLHTIETQAEQLKKYETKLRDVVRAYKSLQSEKAALEDSLNAISTVNNEKSYDDIIKDTEDQEIQDDNQGISQSHSGSDLNRLTAALATITKEKTRMEVSFQTDRKQMKQELDDLTKHLQKELRKYDEDTSQLKAKIMDLKSTLLSEQREREKEVTDHAVMLRELQKLLADERIAKENLEHRLDELKIKTTKQQNATEYMKEYESKIRSLVKEMDDLRTRLSASEQKSKQPPPLLAQLKQEISEIKVQNRKELQREQHRAKEAEDRAKMVRLQAEERVATLENKLSELSETMGSYERTRLQDRSTIQTLKEKISQLDMDNSALSRQLADNDTENDDSNLDVNALVEKITTLKERLKLANEWSDKPVDLTELLNLQKDGEIRFDGEQVHIRCQQEYRQLKEEFERYKLRVQSVLKNKKDSAVAKEVEFLKTQVYDLKERLRKRTVEYEEKIRHNALAISNLEDTIVKLREEHDEERIKTTREYKQKIVEFEQEMQKQRERILELLAEKDSEIEILKNYFPKSTSGAIGVENEQVPSSNEVNVDILPSINLEGPLLHFNQEISRRDVEITSLRKTKHQLEQALRELQQSVSMKEEKYREQIEFMEAKIHDFQRSRSRENANLEYLKNVLYSFLLSSDVTDKKPMMNAIATVLEFSPLEKEQVEHALQNKWWSSSPAGKEKPISKPSSRLKNRLDSDL